MSNRPQQDTFKILVEQADKLVNIYVINKPLQSVTLLNRHMVFFAR